MIYEYKYGKWDNKVLELFMKHKNEWFSSNEISKHFNITHEDTIMILYILERGGSIKKKSSKKITLFRYMF